MATGNPQQTPGEQFYSLVVEITQSDTFVHYYLNFVTTPDSVTVSAPHRVVQIIFSTSSSMDDATAELPMFALIFTKKLRPIIIGSSSG